MRTTGAISRRRIENLGLENAGLMNWYERHRQNWIMEMLWVYGFINREHLMRKFSISRPQASNDLQRYIREHRGEVQYNLSAKRYERVGEPGYTRTQP